MLLLELELLLIAAEPFGVSGELSVFQTARLCVLGKGSGGIAVGNSGFSRF